MPRGVPNRSRELETTDYLPNLDDSEQVLDYRSLKIELVAQPIVHVSEREFDTAAEAAAFSEEPVVIRVHPTGDENAPPMVPVGCNGEVVWLPRGQPVRLPRKFVESLCRYDVRFSSQRANNPNADEGMVQRKRASQPYPFTVVADKNPKGRAWLERVMRGG